MRNWILISIVTIILAVGALAAAQEDAKQLAAKGHSVFLQVLGGDESKLPEAIRYMEDARQLDPTNVNNLYNLGRANASSALARDSCRPRRRSHGSSNWIRRRRKPCRFTAPFSPSRAAGVILRSSCRV